MKLQKIIERVNLNEISKFYNILTNLIPEKKDLDKKADPESFVEIFNTNRIRNLYKESLMKAIKKEVDIDIATDILIRDGNSIMSIRWFEDLFEKELKEIEQQINNVKNILEKGTKEINELRIRDYKIYHNCVKTAFTNDLEKGKLEKITDDELTVLNTLKESLELSNTEARGIYLFTTNTDLKKYRIDSVIEKLKSNGIGFYITKEKNLYIPEEFIILLREIKGIKLAEKYQRRILICLDDTMINELKRKHGIKAKNRHEKIEELIKQGIDIENVLNTGIFKDSISENDKKKILNNIIENKLGLYLQKSGRSVNEKISLLLQYYEKDEIEQNIGMSKEGYDEMMRDLLKIDGFERKIRDKFELDEKKVKLLSEDLLDYNIKPKDILYLLPLNQIKEFCKLKGIKYRGENVIRQVLENYTKSEDRYIENYTLIAKNDKIGLKENGILIESGIGLLFEKVTKQIFTKMNLTVNEELKKSINNRKNKADIIIEGVNDKTIYIVECKSSQKDFASFSDTSRQIKAYVELYSKKGYFIQGVILVSNSFTEEFKDSVKTFPTSRISLLEAMDLYDIYEEYKRLGLETFPLSLLGDKIILSENVIKGLRQF
ncbi:MAG: hypothetical protein JXR69_04770 [Candidatus Delongbacteria bacterium]|nr:hypothetical protein [Candidatus Delongbacteria bacterium]